MRPNITKQFKDLDEILFECRCHGKHYLTVSHWWKDKELIFCFIDQPSSLWDAIRWWWKQRKTYHSEMILDRKDIKALAKILNDFVERTASKKSK